MHGEPLEVSDSGLGNGLYCDGRSPCYIAAKLTLTATGLEVQPVTQSSETFRLADLIVASPVSAEKTLALKPSRGGKMRILVQDSALAATILMLKPELQAPQARVAHGGGKGFGLAIGVIGFCVAAFWAFDAVLPQYLAKIVPVEWLKAEADSQEHAFAELGRRCTNSAGDAAIAAMLKVLATGDAAMPAVDVHIYNLPFANAFALPAGRILLSQKLIDEAARPEEVAGVLAHEIGHVVHGDPEMHLVRGLGIQIFYDALGTSRSGGTAAVIEHFRQNRQAEDNADAYARKIMTAAEIDPTGLKDMFNRLLHRERAAGMNAPVIETWGSLFSTHPGTAERISKITPLPAGVTPKPVLSDLQWQALRRGCA